MIPTAYYDQSTPDTGRPILDSFAHRLQPNYEPQGPQYSAEGCAPFHGIVPSNLNTQATSAPGAQDYPYGTVYTYDTAVTQPDTNPNCAIVESTQDTNADQASQWRTDEDDAWQWRFTCYANGSYYYTYRPNVDIQDTFYGTQETQQVPNDVDSNPAYWVGNEVYHTLGAEDPEYSPYAHDDAAQQATQVDNQQAFLSTQNFEPLPLSSNANSTTHVTNDALFPAAHAPESTVSTPAQDWASNDGTDFDFNLLHFQTLLQDFASGGSAGDYNGLLHSINGSMPADGVAQVFQGQSWIARDVDDAHRPYPAHFSPSIPDTSTESSPANSIFSRGANFTPATTPAASPLVALENEGNHQATVAPANEPRQARGTGKRKRARPNQNAVSSNASASASSSRSSSRASRNTTSAPQTSSALGSVNLVTPSPSGIAVPSSAFTFTSTVPGAAASAALPTPTSHRRGTASNASASSSRASSRARDHGPSTSASTTFTSNGAGTATSNRPSTSTSQRHATASTPGGPSNPTLAQASGSLGEFASSSSPPSKTASWNVSTAHVISPPKGDRATKLLTKRRGELTMKPYHPKK